METIDYKIGDEIVSKNNPGVVIGVCTGFAHNYTCIVIDGKVCGGKTFFMKSEWTECEVLD